MDQAKDMIPGGIGNMFFEMPDVGGLVDMVVEFATKLLLLLGETVIEKISK